MIHLSSKDSPSMVKVTTREVQFTTIENEEKPLHSKQHTMF